MTATRVDGYTITDETIGDEGDRYLILRGPEGSEVINAYLDGGQWFLDGETAGYKHQDIGLISEDSARELLMIIASLLPVPVK